MIGFAPAIGSEIAAFGKELVSKCHRYNKLRTATNPCGIVAVRNRD